MITLTNWTAKRSGGRITIAGTDRRLQQPHRLTEVDEIAARPDGTIVAIKVDRPVAILATSVAA